MVFLEVILGVSLCLFVLAKWWQWSSRRFWMVNGVSYIPGIPFIGALKEAFLFKKSIGELILDLYNDEKTKNQPISGFYFFHKASLIIREPELIKRILVKDFNFFQDRRVATDAQSDTIGGNTMPLIKGENWKNIRSNISPIFTGVKMKNFYLLLKEVCEVFEEKLSREICIEKQYDIKELSGHLTVDMLAICAFGVNANSLNNSQSQFYEQARSISNFTWRRAINFCGCFFFPELASFLKFTMFPDSVNNFMRDSINYVMEQREQSGTKRNDLID
uniref:Uncharacterized protein n=1 Tax=Phlebotomus papatasi TaxID=29031 RepID=A0A1B0GPC3_PHLPP